MAHPPPKWRENLLRRWPRYNSCMLKGRFERLFIKGILWFGVAALAGVSVFLAGSVWDVRGKERISWQEKENARLAYEDLKARHEDLSEGVGRLETERGIEEELRGRFPVAKEGEEVIILVDAPESGGEAEKKPPAGLWGVLRSWLGTN